MVMLKRFLMVITNRYCLSFIVVLFVAALSGFDLPDILSVFRQKLSRSVPAYPIKKNTTNGFQAFLVPDSVTGSEPYDEELKHTLATHGLRAY
jgi:hypothetical protein